MIQNPFIRNRAEEFDQDVWESYVLPHYFPQLGFSEARKSVVLQGGRGCGKTALLRYLSYQSQFSEKRADIPPEALQTIGLYLKADSTYFSTFTGYGKDEEHWRDLFEHALCLALAEQIIYAINKLNCTPRRAESFAVGLSKLDFSDAVGGFAFGAVPPDFRSFGKWLRLQRQHLSRYFKNRDDPAPAPTLFPMKAFLTALIEELRSKLAYLSDSVFAVYIDEYENLLEYQQKFLNTMIKGGEQPLIFHVAMKPNGMRTRQTLGPESIQQIADYRLIPLDEYLGPTFSLFCAELFFFRLVTEGKVPEDATPINAAELRSASGLPARAKDEYRRRVLDEIGRILPGQKYAEVAAQVFVEQALRKRWETIVQHGLKERGSPLKPADFRHEDFPEESVVNAALLHQRSKQVDEIAAEFKKLTSGQASKYKTADWTHHFLLGTLLLVHRPNRLKSCPIYAGFPIFVQLAAISLRHFLELCHLSIGDPVPTQSLADFVIPVQKQAQAATLASRKFREEVSSFGDLGNRLFAMVNLLGKLFQISQARYSQSEPERTHFTVVGEELSPAAAQVVSEAVKWSVVFEVPETKTKGSRFESNEYLLNPIYAPFFGISPNKGRKLELQASEAETMLLGGFDELSRLLRHYEVKWGADIGDQFSLGLED